MAMKSIIDKSAELKDYVTHFDIDSFCGFCSFFIRQHSQGKLLGNMAMFQSVQKDLTYLIALNYFNQNECRNYFPTTEESIAVLAHKVNDIKASYIKDSWSELRMNVDRSYQHRALVHEQIFCYYYHNGVLNYMEQEVNRIRLTYGPHDAMIKAATGLIVEDYIDCFVALENIQRAKDFNMREVFRALQIQEAPIFSRAIVTADDREEFVRTIETLPNNLRSAFLSYNKCPHGHLKVSVDELSAFVDKKLAAKFLEQLSADPEKHKGFSYYDQMNPLEAHPLLRIGKEYMHTNGKQLLVAINGVLFDILQDRKTPTRAHRAVESQLEQQTRNVLERFFGKGKFRIHQNYHIPGGIERDLLIEIGPKVIVCECKSTRLRSPLRDIEKFYTKAHDDFKKSIQLGYEQAQSVADLITQQDETVLYDHKGKERGRIARRAAKDVCVWVVTDRSLGPAQVDLSYMLESNKDLMDFPWSVCVDDLETFLLYLSKRPNQYSRLFDYLRFRPRLYGRVISPDELDLAGWYVSNRAKFLSACMADDEWVLVELGLQNVFDKDYHSAEGIGFPRDLKDRFLTEDDFAPEDDTEQEPLITR